MAIQTALFRHILMLMALFMVIAIAPTPDAQAEDIYRDNIDYLGADIPNRTIAGITKEQCQQECAAEYRCMAWTLTKPGTYEPQSRCFLKQSVPPATANPCCVSGRKLETVLPTMLNNTDQLGNDTNEFGGLPGRALVLSQPDPAACLSKCESTPGCEGWTYVKPGIFGQYPLCFVKKPLPVNRTDNAQCCISGFITNRFAHQNTSRFGRDNPISMGAGGLSAGNISLTGQQILVADHRDAAACRNSCMKQDECMSWTFIEPSALNRRSCVLSHQLSRGKQDSCCLSGAKTRGGYQIVSGPFVNIAPGASANTIVQCPGNKIALSAMHEVAGGDSKFFAEIKSSWVTRQLASVRARNISGSQTVSIKVSAVCIDPIPGLQEQRSFSGDPNGTSGPYGAFMTCNRFFPPETLIGGGFDVANELFPGFGFPRGNSAPLSTSQSNEAWQLVMEIAGDESRIAALAICVPRTNILSAAVIVGNTVSVPGGKNSRKSTATCPQGSRPVAGGHTGTGPGTTMLTTMSRISPSNPQTYEVEITNRSIWPPDTVTGAARVLCLEMD